MYGVVWGWRQDNKVNINQVVTFTRWFTLNIPQVNNRDIDALEWYDSTATRRINQHIP